MSLIKNAPDEGYELSLNKLSRAQLQCLVLVVEGLTSKEIAVALGVSNHTVDERLKRSLKVLGVASRREAGRIVAASGNWAAYQRLVYQSPDLSDDPWPPLPQPMPSGFHSGVGSEDLNRSEHFWKFIVDYLPFPTQGRETNQLSYTARIVMIVILAIFIALAFGSLVSAVEAISMLFQ